MSVLPGCYSNMSISVLVKQEVRMLTVQNQSQNCAFSSISARASFVITKNGAVETVLISVNK